MDTRIYRATDYRRIQRGNGRRSMMGGKPFSYSPLAMERISKLFPKTEKLI
jgi:hypothetical protein